MPASVPPARATPVGGDRRIPKQPGPIPRMVRPIRAFSRAVVFFLKVFPMIPSRPIDWVTTTPMVEKGKYPARTGMAKGDIYRPSGDGPFPGMLVCLGVVPFGVDHPQVPVLGNALARAGFAALLYWSPAMRDFRLDAEDVENISLAYDWFVEQPIVDPARTGLLGTCVGGSFALMAAATPLIRDRVAFIATYAPFSSMRTFAVDIASGSCCNDAAREPWQVDQLTRRVFVHSLTAFLDANEAERLRSGFASADGQFDGGALSEEGQKVFDLLTAGDAVEAENALNRLPPSMLERFEALSPINYLDGLRTPLIVHLHDRGDQVIPVGESRRLHALLDGPAEVHFTEMQFSHLDPTKGKLPFFHLLREFGKFFRTIFPLFRQAVP